MLWLWLACAQNEYDFGDLELDIDAAVPANAETARTCVEGVGTREEGAGNGRLAVPGIPDTDPIVITVEMLDKEGILIGRSTPMTLSAETPYGVTDFAAASGEPCVTEGAFAPEGSSSWLLVIRFLGSGW